MTDVLDGQRDPVQRSAQLADTGQLVSLAGLAPQFVDRLQLDQRIDRAIALGNALQVELQQVHAGQRAPAQQAGHFAQGQGVRIEHVQRSPLLRSSLLGIWYMLRTTRENALIPRAGRWAMASRASSVMVSTCRSASGVMFNGG